MEITSFILGVLAVIGVAVVTLVVVGTVKIHKQNQIIKNLDIQLQDTQRTIYQSISDEMRYLSERLSRMDDRSTLMVEDLKRELTSYVDSRIDKLQAKKEVIKG